MRKTKRDTWFTTTLGVGQICAWGALYYSYPLIVETMMPEMGWSRVQAYAPATLGLVLAALLTYPVGWAIDRGWGRWVMSASSLMAAVFFIAWSLVNTLDAFLIIATVLGALQAATLYEPAFAILARKVGADHARAGITRITLWGGFASTVFIPVIQLVIESSGWRTALALLAGIHVGLCLLYLWAIRPECDAEQSRHDISGTRESDHAVLVAVLHQKVFWLLLVAMFAYAAAFSAFTFHMYPMLLEHGLDARQVVVALAVIGPAQVAGRLLISRLGDGTSMRFIGCLTVAVLPPVFVAMYGFGGSFVAAVILCGVYGAANGIFTIVRSLIIPEMLTSRAYGALNGLINVPATLARAAAPWATAVMWGIANSYGPVLAAITLTFAVMALAFWAAAWLSLRGKRLFSTRQY